jgi:hypothetical protein
VSSAVAVYSPPSIPHPVRFLTALRLTLRATFGTLSRFSVALCVTIRGGYNAPPWFYERMV